MAKMTQSTFSALYEFGKKVYEEQIDLKTAAQQVSSQNPEVAISSAKHYILWYSKMRVGEFLTWNTNSDLLLYYARKITEENGVYDGKLAIYSAIQFARHVSRSELERDLIHLADEYGIKLDMLTREDDDVITQKVAFQDWLKNLKTHTYTNHVIYKYTRALEMAEEWLSIKLPSPIFEITSLEAFNKCNKIIKSVPNYVEINKAHGHGDLSAALSLYSKFLAEQTKSISNWWPSLEEYTPGFTKEQWLEILNNPEIVGPVWGGVLAMFHTEPEGATCKMLADKFNDSPYSISGKCTQLAKKIHSETKCPLITDNADQEKRSYWPILFQGRDVKGDESGTWVWKLRKELYDALTEFGIEKYLPQEVEEGEKMTTKEKVSAIKSYIASKGFNYEGYLIENFYLSLKSKPFVILAGTSGTGKTRLVKLFAEAIDAKMLLVPVRPDWSDSSDLFGHVDLSGEFNPGAILEFIKEAQDNIDKPYFLCLDEMNLARVEYYFSDFLSIIETRENVEGKIVSDSLVDEKYYKKDTAAVEKYGKIIIPENLYIIGTVNMDETTFPFSKKVLDRANTIEFSFVNLTAKAGANTVIMPRPLNEDNSFLKTKYLYFNDVEYNKDVENLCSELADLNDILLGANLHVGYRVRDEITFYMINNKNAAELIPNDAAFDNQIMQKILPRIQGSSLAIKEVLVNLFKKCGQFDGLSKDSKYDELNDCIKNKGCKYPNSAKKIAFMVRRFEEDGFTSYWL